MSRVLGEVAASPHPTSSGVWGCGTFLQPGARVVTAAKILFHFRGARRPLLELVGAKLAEAMAPCPFLCSDATCCQITLDTCSSQERERVVVE